MAVWWFLLYQVLRGEEEGWTGVDWIAMREREKRKESKRVCSIG